MHLLFLFYKALPLLSISLCNYWHPRCKLTPSDEEHATSDDSDIDPSVSATVECMTTDEGIWKMRYFTSKATGTALTADEFFTATPYTASELATLVVGGK